MTEVNLRAIDNQQNALQSHRGGTGEVRFTTIAIRDAAGREVTSVVEGGRLNVRAGYTASARVDAPVFQIAIIDVDTGMVVATATSATSDVPSAVSGDGVMECCFDDIPLRRRQYALRLTITDSHQLMSYDVVTAGPRFAVTAGAVGPARSAEDEDGLVSVPYRFVHRQEAVVAGATRPL
jgi:hypothetical protein